MSITITLSGQSSSLNADFFPPINVNDGGDWELGLVDFETFHVIPNVDSTNNLFHYDTNQVITIPGGSYELEAINKFIQENISREPTEKGSDVITIRANMNTLKSEIKCKYSIDFSKENTIGSLFGFSATQRLEQPNQWYKSDSTVNIIKINIIRIECSVTSGAYTNGTLSHVIHEFFPRVPPGYKISESPTNVIYLPVIARLIDRLNIRIVDQNNKLIDFGSEEVTVRLHLRRK